MAYLNSDVNDRGFLDLSGSHILERLLNQVANTVVDPETGLTTGRRLRLARIANAPEPARADLRGRPELRLEALGSGSDFTPFLQHLGIASANLGFGGEQPGSGGVYHSIYDTFTWYGQFADSSFAYGRALALVTGLSVMRLASADVVPYQFGALADAVEGYAGEVKQLLASKGDAARERNRQLDEGVFQAIRDPRSPDALPPRDSVPPFLNFAPLDNSPRVTPQPPRRAMTRLRRRGSGAVCRRARGSRNSMRRWSRSSAPSPSPPASRAAPGTSTPSTRRGSIPATA